ncbi:MAG: HEAT repeat domain-containing protein, partial [Candidatus Poribacteria bacterium]|nr:HEAT repeat domain-containing protein [Candidatus Poribacteria bacterium]
IEALGHFDWQVRARIAISLGSIGEPAKEAVPALIGRLQDVNMAVRDSASWALARIGTPEAVQAAEAFTNKNRKQ